MDPDTSTIRGVIALQYNPDSLSRSLQIQAVPGGQDGVRVDALRLRGPAIETIKIEAELDATLKGRDGGGELRRRSAVILWIAERVRKPGAR